MSTLIVCTGFCMDLEYNIINKATTTLLSNTHKYNQQPRILKIGETTDFESMTVVHTCDFFFFLFSFFFKKQTKNKDNGSTENTSKRKIKKMGWVAQQRLQYN
jgi:hypothetical protein